MNRRFFLKVSAAVFFSCGRVPNIWGKAILSRGLNRSIAHEDDLKDYLFKMKNFDTHHKEDIYIEPEQCHLLESTVLRLKRVQRTVGHGNFCLLNFDDTIKIARSYNNVGEFSKEELDFLEQIFYKNSSEYGFLDTKPFENLTDRIKTQKAVKISYSGNYLYKGLPLETYKVIRDSIGEKVILTSGLRSITKQFYLFLNKVYSNHGNLSLASRSLAPPGYSFHGVGDFDVGQVNFGTFNFTERFTASRVYKKLRDLGYTGFRYPKGNHLGVRFEPWHIKVG